MKQLVVVVVLLSFGFAQTPFSDSRVNSFLMQTVSDVGGVGFTCPASYTRPDYETYCFRVDWDFQSFRRFWDGYFEINSRQVQVQTLRPWTQASVSYSRIYSVNSRSLVVVYGTGIKVVVVSWLRSAVSGADPNTSPMSNVNPSPPLRNLDFPQDSRRFPVDASLISFGKSMVSDLGGEGVSCPPSLVESMGSINFGIICMRATLGAGWMTSWDALEGVRVAEFRVEILTKWQNYKFGYSKKDIQVSGNAVTVLYDPFNSVFGLVQGEVK